MRITIILAKNIEKKGSKDPAFRSLLFKKGLCAAGLQEYSDKIDLDRLAVSGFGKPYFIDRPDIHFNISHSGDYIACAFSDREIGLDLQECSRPFTDILRLGKRFFTSEEYEALRSFPQDQASGARISDRDRSGRAISGQDFYAGDRSGQDISGQDVYAEDRSGQDVYGRDISGQGDFGRSSCRRDRFFFRLWSVKEAYLKYVGCGLQGELNSFLPDPFPVLSKASPALTSASLTADLTACRGSIRIQNNSGLLSPAEYALVPAPPGYVMAVSAQKLPDLAEILCL